MITGFGQPVEFFLAAGIFSDTQALKLCCYDLPEGSKLTGDKAYHDYEVEDKINQVGISMISLRKRNFILPFPSWGSYLR